jgi:histone deacetylase complex regulatory component SIN3
LPRKALQEAPRDVIPIILDRMRQKSQEWSVMKQQWVPRWAKEYQKYHRKSLDHEGSNYKEEMKKLQDPNGIILDAKERTAGACVLFLFSFFLSLFYFLFPTSFLPSI